jgi:hypothetical protein
MKKIMTKNELREKKKRTMDTFFFVFLQTKNNCMVGGTELDAEKDLRYKLIQKFKKLQQRELVKEKSKLRALVKGNECDGVSFRIKYGP